MVVKIVQNVKRFWRYINHYIDNKMNYDIKKVDSSEVHGHCFTIKNMYSFNIYVSQWPTQNCQLSSIGLVEALFNFCELKDIPDIIRECYKIINHTINLILLDVKSGWVSHVEKCFKVVVKTPYTSTNGSSMCLFIVKLE